MKTRYLVTRTQCVNIINLWRLICKISVVILVQLYKSVVSIIFIFSEKFKFSFSFLIFLYWNTRRNKIALSFPWKFIWNAGLFANRKKSLAFVWRSPPESDLICDSIERNACSLLGHTTTTLYLSWNYLMSFVSGLVRV